MNLKNIKVPVCHHKGQYEIILAFRNKTFEGTDMQIIYQINDCFNINNKSWKLLSRIRLYLDIEKRTEIIKKLATF